LLSTFAFKFNWRRYIEVGTALAKLNGQVQMGEVNASDDKSQALVRQYAPGLLADDDKCVDLVGWCRLNLSNPR
jgi:hypothetical protein